MWRTESRSERIPHSLKVSKRTADRGVHPESWPERIRHRYGPHAAWQEGLIGRERVKITVIVPTYNRPKALELCLLSLAEQSLVPDEVMIADDGSGPETAEIVRKSADRLKSRFPVKHVWQEDEGFRKPKILNETVRQSSGEYLIFLDGDCTAHRHFVLSHINVSASNVILSGKRVDIGKALTERILERGRPVLSITGELIWDAVFGKDIRSRKVEEALRMENRVLRRLLHRDRITDDGVWGCNFSLYKELFYAINGCDEDFIDGSIEDNDLGIRVLNQGGKLRSVRNYANIFHLWHRSSWSFQNEKYLHNLAIMKRRIANKEKQCRNGIRKIDQLR
jgi:glycosyltransferase involved in cell wall biosynthesis